MSAAFSETSGSIGSQVVSRGRSGLSLRSKPTYRYPKIAVVQAGSDRLKAANQAWNTLTVAQFDAWNAYAEGLTHHNDLTGEPYHPSDKNAFVGLGIKFLQVNPALPVPLSPPSGSFLPDSVVVSCAAISGGLRFTASAPNRAGVVIEILIQPLLNARRSPTQFYKSAAFVAFTSGGLGIS